MLKATRLVKWDVGQINFIFKVLFLNVSEQKQHNPECIGKLYPDSVLKEMYI